jgi:RNA polymerase-binding transcription factor DksA
MDLMALTMLQGRLFDIAFESDTQLRLLREDPVAQSMRDDEGSLADAARESHSALIEFWQRRRSTALSALERIEKGLFGSCIVCGQEIGQLQLFVRLDRLTCPACDSECTAQSAPMPGARADKHAMG